MASLPINTTKWKVSSVEVARYAPKRGNANASSLKLYIPKLMPLIAEGTPKQEIHSILSTCYANASACKPSIAKTIKTQNYITVPRHINQPFGNNSIQGESKIKVTVSFSEYNNLTGTFEGDTIYKSAEFSAGAKIMVDVKNKNVDTMYVNNSIDNSTPS